MQLSCFSSWIAVMCSCLCFISWWIENVHIWGWKKYFNMSPCRLKFVRGISQYFVILELSYFIIIIVMGLELKKICVTSCFYKCSSSSVSLVLSRELNFVTRHNDAVSLRELLCPGVFPLLHNIQVQWPVSVWLNQGSATCPWPVKRNTNKWLQEMTVLYHIIMVSFVFLCCSSICRGTKKSLNNLLSNVGGLGRGPCNLLSEVWCALEFGGLLLNNITFVSLLTLTALQIVKPCIPGLPRLIITCHIVHACFTVVPFNWLTVIVCSICSSEYNAFWRCVQAGATYLFVQLCKVSELHGD